MTIKRHIILDTPSSISVVPGRPSVARYQSLCGQSLTVPGDNARIVSWENARPSSTTICKTCLASKKKMVRERKSKSGTDLKATLLELRDSLESKRRS